MGRKRLGEILVHAGVLDETRLRVALDEQRRRGGPLGRLLVEMKLVPEEIMVQALSHQLNLPAVNLDALEVEPAVLDLVPADLAEQHAVVPFHRQGSFLDVAMADPTNLGIIDELRIRLQLNIHPYLAGPKSIERALARFYNRGVVAISLGNEVALDPGTLRPVAPRAPGPPPLAPASSPPTTAAARRAQQQQFLAEATKDDERTRELRALQERVTELEALLARDEDVLRKLLGLLVAKGILTREEILERIK